ncbi:MAG TPA: V-type ATP synthase subunit F [Gammaproteobacteria bacterium]|nr:V-type ATP synthase subunit F [Gammaproteobacteria bacterium]
MPAVIFIGDEASASAYRLGGARIRVTSEEKVAADLDWACREAELVLITAEFAAQLPSDELRRMQARLRPLLLVVPDVRGRMSVPDLSRWIRAQLGLEA